MALVNGATILGESASSTFVDQVDEMVRSSKEITVESAVEQTRLDFEQKLLVMATKIDKLKKGLDEVRSGTAMTGLTDRFPKSSALGDTTDPWPSAISHTIQRLPMASSSPCGRGCSCQCHSARSSSYTRREFSGLQHALGSISITFLGSRQSVWTPGESRTNTDCRNSQRYAWRIRYSFPRWLARSVVSACYAWHPDAPELLIRVHHVLPPGSLSYDQSIFEE